MFIESNPPGAKVLVNNVEAGVTPCDYPFVYYGTYNITLIADGYETQTFEQKIVAPWYEYPPLDFFAEQVWPFTENDVRPLYYELRRTRRPNPTQIQIEANELRARGKELPPPSEPPPETPARGASPVGPLRRSRRRR